VAALLEGAEPGLHVELMPIRTSGDERASGPPPPGPDDKSRFTKEIEAALLRAEVDVGVHSAKDVPAEIPEGLALVGVPARADPRDAVCGADSLDALPAGAVVGTSSLRRRSQLLAGHPELRVADLRGNVDTRLRRLAQGRFDALVLAAAGLRRLGRDEGVPLPLDLMTPAPGQGCLLLEARAGDERSATLAGRITRPGPLTCLSAERALVRELQATCRTPVAAHAAVEAGGLVLAAYVGLPDGSRWVRDSLAGDPTEPEALGRQVAQRLLAAGAREVLELAEETRPLSAR
jgi:hydroxymethylbilane synthase